MARQLAKLAQVLTRWSERRTAIARAEQQEISHHSRQILLTQNESLSGLSLIFAGRENQGLLGDGIDSMLSATGQIASALATAAVDTTSFQSQSAGAQAATAALAESSGALKSALEQIRFSLTS